MIFSLQFHGTSFLMHKLDWIKMCIYFIGVRFTILWPFQFKPILISWSRFTRNAYSIWFALVRNFSVFCTVPESITNAFTLGYAKIISKSDTVSFALHFSAYKNGTPFNSNTYIRLSHLISSAVSAFALNLMRFEHRSSFALGLLLVLSISLTIRMSIWTPRAKNTYQFWCCQMKYDAKLNVKPQRLCC